MPQRDDFRDWCAFIGKKTGSGQVWNKTYIKNWIWWLDSMGLELMIKLVGPWEFTNCVYALEILSSFERAKDEEEWEAFKAQERIEATHDRTTKSSGWNAETELQSIIDHTGLPRGPEVMAFRQKWNLHD